ncbi:MAG TPA: hypothetical protein VJY35_10850 [Candidatus Eisenbacteria bacterium]|nr:hypothetical protein [Candidatus Eisenbacteria bacterium]
MPCPNPDGGDHCGAEFPGAALWARRLVMSLVACFLTAAPLIAQDDTRPVVVDRSKPVPTRADVIAAWQKRQDAIRTFRFEWTEEQVHPRGWVPNPRFPEREWLNIPNLLRDRSYTVHKTLVVDGDRMRYSFDFDRGEEPDGIRVKAPAGGRNDGMGVRRHYRYLSVFDGQSGRTTITSLTESPPPAARPTVTNVDAQNLDTRPILLSFRALDPVMGHQLIERAVTNERRRFHRGSSVFFLEERHDPSGWKTMTWIEPERDYLVRRFDVLGEQNLIAAIDIDYVEDPRWGWIPSGWRISEMLSDRSRRLVSQAKVTSYRINEPIAPAEFR